MKLSKESEKFIGDLRVYLFSSGKNETETEEIIDQLIVHLHEAEKDGKSIEQVVGSSPEEYMAMISEEMEIDYKQWSKYAALIIFGSFAIKIFTDLLNGPLSYSMLAISGHVVITLLSLGLIFSIFRLIATKDFKERTQFMLILPIVLLPIALFVGLIFLDRAIETPTIHFGSVGSTIIGILAALLLIAISIWAKVWILVIITLALVLPTLILQFTNLSEEIRIATGSLISFVAILIYTIFNNQDETKKEDH
ncbi:MAG TPA: hypothetical protein VK061_04815 [Bacillota bacterium]|nr:hypothetical protein [Bacillota bacterium]